MRKEFRTFEVGGESFPVTWDMTAWATLERLTKSPDVFTVGFKLNAQTTIFALWAAIDAAAAHHDKDAPITMRRLGSLLTSPSDVSRAGDLIAGLLKSFAPEPEPGKAEAPATESRSHSGAATSSPPATLESVSAPSGG